MSWWWLTFNLITKPTSHVPNLDQNKMKQSEVFVLVTRTESRKPALLNMSASAHWEVWNNGKTYLNPGLSIIQHNMVEHNMET